MPVLELQYQSAWENNVYVLTTTRILVIVGVTYLSRSIYHWARPVLGRLPLANLVSWAAGKVSHPICCINLVSSANAAVDRALAATSTAVDLTLDDLIPDSSSTLAVNADLSNIQSVHPPQPSYDPSHRPQRPQALPPPPPESHQCSTSSDIPTHTSSQTVASNVESGSGGSASDAITIDGQSL